jgi:hypothetical protein
MSGESEEEQKVRESRKGVATIPGLHIPLSFKIGKSEWNFARYLAPLYIYKYEDSEMDLADLSKFLPFNVDKVERPQLGEKGDVPGFGDAAWGWVGSLIADRDFRGISIQNPKASKYHNPNITTEERILNVLNYVGRTQIPFYKSAQDIYDGATGRLDYYGRNKTFTQSILNSIIKIQQFDKPELKNYIERNITYLTNRFADLSARMGDANSDFLKTVKDAKDKGLSDESVAKIYESADKARAGQLGKSLDEQIPVMQELERLTGVYKKWFPDDQFIQDNYQSLEAGQMRRFNVLDDVDLQKKYPTEYNLLRSNGVLKAPKIPKFYQGQAVTDEQRKVYSNAYWSEYLREMDGLVGMTKEEFAEKKSHFATREKADTQTGYKKVTDLDYIASEAASRAELIAQRAFRK